MSTIVRGEIVNPCIDRVLASAWCQILRPRVPGACTGAWSAQCKPSLYLDKIV